MTESTSKTYSLNEIALHSSKDSLWLLIENGVYDVTKFLPEHPGGEEPMLEQSGIDATEAFLEVGHSSDARELMKQYKIGELCEEDRQGSKGASKPFSKCFRWAVPIGVLLVAVFTYKMYTYLRK